MLFVIMLFPLTQFGNHCVEVPVRSKEDEGTNSHERPRVSNQCSRNDYHDDHQHDDKQVDQCLIDLLGIHCGVSLSLLLLMLMLLELSQVVNDTQQLYSAKDRQTEICSS